MVDPDPPPNKAHPSKRFLARMKVVQALYEQEMHEKPLSALLHNFLEDPCKTYNDSLFVEPGEPSSQKSKRFAFDKDYYQKLVVGTLQEMGAVDSLLLACLEQHGSLDRMDATLRSILRAGAFELTYGIDIPSGVIINEYVNIAHAFFRDDTPALVHGVLAAIIHKVREIPS